MPETLKELRLEKGLSQKEVADAVGITQSMLAMLERGERSGSDLTKAKLANFYGKTVDSIFFARYITKCN